MLRTIVSALFLSLFCVFSVYAGMPVAGGDFEILDSGDQVRVMDYDESDGSWSWRIYNSLSTFISDVQASEDVDSWFDDDTVDVVMYYAIDPADQSPAHVDPFYYRLEIDVSVRTTDDHTSIAPQDTIPWRWARYPHVHFIDYPVLTGHAHTGEVALENLHFLYRQNHPDSVYADFYTTDLAVGFESNLQTMVDNGRAAYGIDVFPDELPPTWSEGLALDGGDWTQFSSDVHRYFIARIDLAVSRQPDIAASFREQFHRRYHHDFDGNDFVTQTVIEANNVQVDTTTNTVSIRFANAREIYDKLHARQGWVEIAARDDYQTYYVGQATRKSIDGLVITLTVDPHEKQGEFQDGDVVKLELEQN